LRWKQIRLSAQGPMSAVGLVMQPFHKLTGIKWQSIVFDTNLSSFERNIRGKPENHVVGLSIMHMVANRSPIRFILSSSMIQ
jgi:hypothetical protein